MTTIERLPDETREQFIRRLVATAPPLDPERATRIVALLRSGRVHAKGITDMRDGQGAP